MASKFQVTENGLKDLAKRSKNKKHAKRAMGKNNEVIKEMLSSLDKKPKFTKMVEYSVECLRNLAVDETSVEEMIECGTIDTLLKVLKLNPYNEKITNLVNTCLLAFCKTDAMCKLIGEKLGGAVLVNSLNKHKDPETILTTSKLVSKLACSSEICENFANAGMIEALSKTIKNNPDDEDIIEHATQGLNKIAGYKDYALRVMKTDVIDDVLESLKKYPDNAPLATAATSLIAKVAGSSEEVAERLKKKGAVDIIVAALECHPDDEPLLEAGAAALAALAGAEDIDGVLKVQVGNNIQTANAVSKLASLVLVEENVDHMIKNGGIEWLLAALQAAKGDHSPTASKILSAGCRALQRICLDEHKIYAVMSKGGIKLINEIINEHKDDENVAAASVGALAKCVTRKENAVFIAKAGGTQAVTGAYNQHPDSEKVAKPVLEYYQRMAAHEMVVPSMIKHGALDAIVGIMGKQVENKDLVASSVNSLGRIATNAANVALISQAGGCEALLEALNTHMDDLDVTKQTLLMVETMALVPENQVKLRDLGAVDSILKALECHENDNEVQQIVSRTLGMIAGDAALTSAVEGLQKTATEIIKNPGSVGKLVDRFNNQIGMVSDMSNVDDNKPKLVKAGAVRALIDAWEALNNCPEGPQKQKALVDVARGLLRLADDPDGASQIVKSGIANKLLEACIKYPDNEELQEATMQLIAALAAQEGNVGQLMNGGILAQIMALCQANPMDAAILAAAVAAMNSLATDDDACRAILAAGGAQVIMDSIMANINDPEAVLSALQLMQKLAIDDAAIQALIDAGAIDAILKVLRKYGDNPEIVGACVQSLIQLCINEAIAKEIGDKGGCPLLIKAMREHYQNEPICEADMILLDSLATVQDNADKMLEEELQTVDLVKWIMEAYTANEPLTEAGTRLLEALLGPSIESGLIDGSMVLDADTAAGMLAKLGELNQAQLLGALQNMAAIAQNPANAKMLVGQGALQQLAAIMKANKNNEPLFYAAASAFANLAENGGQAALDQLEDPSLVEAMCEMIKPHSEFANPMNLTDLTKAVGACAKIKMKPETVQEMIKNQPFDALLQMLMESDDDLLLANASRLLGKLSNNEEAAALLSGITNIRELIAAMRRNIANQEFLKYGVYLLGNLAASEALKAEIGIEGGIQLILQIMQTYPNNEGLVENCCYSLATLSYENDINNTFIVACKGIQELLTAMQVHANSEDLLKDGICVLCNLSQDNDTNKEKLLAAGGAQAIVETVLNNFNSLDLVQEAFRTIGSLAYTDDAIKQIVQVGAVQGIVAGMTVHHEEEEIVDLALKVIGALASDEGKETQNIMAMEGAVQAIVEVAAEYHDNVDMEMNALSCLNNFAVSSSNCELMIKQGAAEAAIAALNSCLDDVELVSNAIELLSKLTLSNKNLDRMFQAGVVAAVITALKSHPSEHDIVVHGMKTIGNLAFNKETAGIIGKDGTVDQVIATINANMQDAPILAACYQALSGLCRADANAKKMAPLSMKRLVTNFQTHANNEVFLGYGFAYLGNLCVNADAAQFVLTTGMVAGTVAAINGIATNPHLTMRGLRALENTAFSSKAVKQHMKDEQVIPACERLSSMSTRDDVKTSCAAVINAINATDEEFADMPFVTFNKPAQVTTTKSARNIFGDVEVYKPPELSEATRNYLQAGKMLMKHSKTAAPRPRHVYVSQDLKFLIWKDPKSKSPPTEEQKMKVFKIKVLESGRCTPQLMRKRFGKFLAKDECAFAVFGRNRTVDLECDSEQLRDKWVAALTELVEWTKACKASAKQFGASATGRTE